MSTKSYEYELPALEKADAALEDIDIQKDDDKLLAQKITARLQDGKALHDEKSKMAEQNKYLFQGKLDKVDGTENLSKYNSKAIKNVIFLTIRNLVGLATDNPPVPDVAPAKKTKPSQEKARTIALALEQAMSPTHTGFIDSLAKNLFDTWIKADSYLHYFWNEERNDIDVETVKLEELTFSTGATDIQDADYLIYHPLKSRRWYKAHYPDHYEDIRFEQVAKDGTLEHSSQRGSVARIFIYHENDFVVEMVMGKEGEFIILDKKEQNPYYEYRSTDDQIMEWASAMYPEAVTTAEEAGLPDAEGVSTVLQDMQIDVEEEFVPIINYFQEPKKPFIQIPSIKLGGELYSEDIISQIRQVFIDLCKKKRQIADNLRGCNSKLVVDSNAFDEKSVAAITDEPLQVLLADFQASPKPVYWAEPTRFEIDKIMLDMADDQQYIDDVFGHHEISRGAGNAGTLGQDQMNFESDKTPIRFQTRAIETAIVELWQGWIQLMKMFYTEVHYVKKLGASDGMEMIELMNKDIEDGVEPILRPMSTAPLSKAAKAQQSFALAQGEKLDPYTLYDDLGRNNPKELADRLVNWLQFGIISSESPERVKADIASEGIDNPVERAAQENEALERGEEVPPTPPEFVTPEHVKLHYAFMQDPEKNLEDDALTNAQNHAEVDKATLKDVLTKGMLQEASRQGEGEGQAQEGNQQPKEQQPTQQ